MLLVRTEGDERLVPLVSEGMSDLERLDVVLLVCAVMWLGAHEAGLASFGIDEAHSLIVELHFRFLRYESLSVR
jgi:hypothetical protein